MVLYAGIDLHSNNNYLGIIDDADQRVYKKQLPNDLSSILSVLDSHKQELRGVVVESTFNWYWLVDGLMDHGYPVHLANPSAIKQYEGLKYVDDKYDSFWLAHMLRLGILPEGYIYPKESRPLRDLLRKRLKLVRQRTSHILSLKSMMNRTINMQMSTNYIKRLEETKLEKLFNNQGHLVMASKCSLAVMKFLSEQIHQLEREIKSQLRLKKEFKGLLNIPGIGDILAMTIMLEVGDIRRFNKVGDYSSYCRCVKSKRISNGKDKGRGNSKNGNKYLSWAYIEAANFAVRYCPYAKKFYQRKLSKSGKEVIAIKALSNKLSKASYYMMRDQAEYNPERLFANKK